MKRFEKPRNRLFSIFKGIFGKTKRQQFGTALILFAVAGLLYIYLPLVQLFIPPNYKDLNTASRIEIPKINVIAPINWNVNPFNEKEYREVLKSGIAHARGTSFPGASGTSYMFAHSSDLPWRITRYNVVFFRLVELEKGDKIVIWRDGKEFDYQVREKKIVWPSEIKYLTESSRTQLILQTCWPIGTAFQRLLVFADPTNF